jgi:WD40 repeat protein
MMSVNKVWHTLIGSQATGNAVWRSLYDHRWNIIEATTDPPIAGMDTGSSQIAIENAATFGWMITYRNRHITEHNWCSSPSSSKDNKSRSSSDMNKSSNSSGVIHETMVLPSGSHVFSCVRIDPTCNYIMAGARDGTIRSWQMRTGRVIIDQTVHHAQISCMAMSQVGGYAVAGSYDRAISVWHIPRGELVRRMTDDIHTAAVRGVIISPTGDRIYTVCDDGHARVFDLVNGTLLAKMKWEQGGRLLCVALHGPVILPPTQPQTTSSSSSDATDYRSTISTLTDAIDAGPSVEDIDKTSTTLPLYDVFIGGSDGQILQWRPHLDRISTAIPITTGEREQHHDPDNEDHHFGDDDYFHNPNGAHDDVPLPMGTRTPIGDDGDRHIVRVYEGVHHDLIGVLRVVPRWQWYQPPSSSLSTTATTTSSVLMSGALDGRVVIWDIDDQSPHVGQPLCILSDGDHQPAFSLWPLSNGRLCLGRFGSVTVWQCQPYKHINDNPSAHDGESKRSGAGEHAQLPHLTYEATDNRNSISGNDDFDDFDSMERAFITAGSIMVNTLPHIPSSTMNQPATFSNDFPLPVICNDNMAIWCSQSTSWRVSLHRLTISSSFINTQSSVAILPPTTSASTPRPTVTHSTSPSSLDTILWQPYVPAKAVYHDSSYI